jgi:hypothetical protein
LRFIKSIPGRLEDVEAKVALVDLDGVAIVDEHAAVGEEPDSVVLQAHFSEHLFAHQQS